jgi:hypothetical protein
MNMQDSFDDRAAELKLKVWVETAAMLLACTTLLYLCQLLDWPFSLLLAPVVVLDLKQLLTTLWRFHQHVR